MYTIQLSSEPSCLSSTDARDTVSSPSNKDKHLLLASMLDLLQDIVVAMDGYQPLNSSVRGETNSLDAPKSQGLATTFRISARELAATMASLSDRVAMDLAEVVVYYLNISTLIIEIRPSKVSRSIQQTSTSS